MCQLIALVRSGFRLCMRRKFVVLSMIVFPVISTFLLFLPSDTHTVSLKTNIAYYSEADNIYSQAIISGLKENNLFILNNVKGMDDKSLDISFKGKVDLPSQFKKVAYAKNINMFIYIPQDIANRIKNGDSNAVVIYDTGNDQKSLLLKSAMEQILTRIKTFDALSNGDSTKLKDMLSNAQSHSLKGVSVSAHNKKDTGDSDKGQKFAHVLGFFSWFAIWGSGFAVTIILQERFFNVYKRIMLTNTGTAKYLASKFVVGAAIGFIQVLLMLVSFKYIVRADYLVHLWQLGLLLFGFILVAITMNFAIVSLCLSESQITYAYIIVINVTAMVSGGYWPFEIEPKWMQNISFLTPQRWITYTISRICSNQPFALAEFWLVIICFIIFFSSIAMLGFKYRNRLGA